jgi:LysR family carnitine catabolism transcriptional activator
MVPNGRQLEAFVRVYRLRSMTTAGRTMHLTQPAISVLIRRLEAAYGTRLFDRANHALRPTPAADAIIDGAERALEEFRVMGDRVKGLGTHALTHTAIAVTPSLGTVVMPTVMKAFEARYPAVKVLVHDVKPEEIAHLVAHHVVEFGMATFETQPDLELQPVADYSLLVVVRRDSSLARRKRIAWRDMSRLRLIVLSQGHVIRRWIEESFAHAGVQFSPAVEVSQFTSAIAMVQQNLGCAIVPSYLGRDYDALGLVARRIDEAPNTRALMMLKRPGEVLSVSASCLLELIRDQVTYRSQ